jgi:hypothetical protein
MKKYIISEEEKRRILNMHKNAILKEQAAPTTQTTGGETVGVKILRLYNEINKLMTEGTSIIQQNKIFKNKGAKFSFSPYGQGTTAAIEIIDGQNKPISVKFGNAGTAPIKVGFQINVAKPYTAQQVQNTLTASGRGIGNALGQEPYNKSQQAVFALLAKIAPLLTDFLNTAIFAFPDKPGTATFDMGGTWGANEQMITGYQNPASA